MSETTIPQPAQAPGAYQVERFDPSPAAARQVVSSGQVESLG